MTLEEFKPKFLKALRSVRYKQGHFVLYNSIEHSYCCLGVACEVAGIATENINQTLYGEPCEVPSELWCNDKIVHNMIRMNDQVGYSFKQIADYVEANL